MGGSSSRNLYKYQSPDDDILSEMFLSEQMLVRQGLPTATQIPRIALLWYVGAALGQDRGQAAVREGASIGSKGNPIKWSLPMIVSGRNFSEI